MKITLILLLLSNILFSFELDKKVALDEDGFWGAHYDAPRYSTYLIVALAAYEGTESRLGKTSWQSLDAGLMSQLFSESAKAAFGRERPRHTDDPTEWGKDGNSFYSGHVTGMTALVTPYILEYQDDYPLIHLLWGLPIWQMGGRVKAQAHWQSDVIVGALAGFAVGYWAHKRESPLLLYFDGDKVVVGLKHRF